MTRKIRKKELKRYKAPGSSETNIEADALETLMSEDIERYFDV